MTRSVWPSDSGWYAVDSLVFVPHRRQKVVQKLATNCGPRSVMIDSGIPPVAEDVVDVKMAGLFGGACCRRWNEMCILGETVDDNHDGVVSFYNGEFDDEIRRNGVPSGGGDGKWLQLS